MMRNEAHTVDWTVVQRDTKRIHFSNSQFLGDARHRPYCLSRPRAGLSPFPSGYEGMARQGALPLVGKVRISLRRCGSASRRAVKVGREVPVIGSVFEFVELGLPTILPTT